MCITQIIEKDRKLTVDLRPREISELVQRLNVENIIIAIKKHKIAYKQ